MVLAVPVDGKFPGLGVKEGEGQEVQPPCGTDAHEK
jgi:hypothetical protein